MICNICYKEKGEEFYKQNGRFMKRCKDCHCKYMRKWHQLNKAAMLDVRKRYYNTQNRTRKMAESLDTAMQKELSAKKGS